MTLSIPMHYDYEFNFGRDWIIRSARTENEQLIIEYQAENQINEIILDLTILTDEQNHIN